MKYDIFISHASEDKESFVRPLADELRRCGLTVWYDEATLKLGDRLRDKIDEGLTNCSYGVVVLSHSFFTKNWPRAELDGLFAREMQGKKVILPLWHNVTKDEVIEFSPMLAGKLAALTDEGVRKVAEKICEVVRASELTQKIPQDGVEERKQHDKPASFPIDPDVDALLRRIRRIFKEHGIEAGHLERFLKIRKAPFCISLSDYQNDNALLAWLTEERIDWIAKTFLVRREWIDGEDEEIHETFNFDKRPKEFFAAICEHAASDWKEVNAGAEAFFIRIGIGDEWKKADRQEILFILAAPLARFSNERIIFKYICDFSGYPWNCVRTNVQTRAWARLISNASMGYLFGCEISSKDAELLQSNTQFLRNIIEKDSLLKLQRWHPDDYAFDLSESLAAKDTEMIPQVIEFLKRHDLPWEYRYRRK